MMHFFLLHMILNTVGFKNVEKFNNTTFTGLEDSIETPSFGRFGTARLIQNRKSKIMGFVTNFTLFELYRKNELRPSISPGEKKKDNIARA